MTACLASLSPSLKFQFPRANFSTCNTLSRIYPSVYSNAGQPNGSNCSSSSRAIALESFTRNEAACARARSRGWALWKKNCFTLSRRAPRAAIDCCVFHRRVINPSRPCESLITLARWPHSAAAVSARKSRINRRCEINAKWSDARVTGY